MRKWIILSIVAILLFAEYVAFFWNNKSVDYLKYDETLYTNEAILNEYNIYENEYIKFLYPKSWEIKEEDASKVVIANSEHGVVAARLEDRDEEAFKYFYLSDKLTQIITKSIHTPRNAKIIKEKIDGNRTIILDYEQQADEGRAYRNIMADTEVNGQRVNFIIIVLDDYPTQKTILDSIVYK